MKNFVFVLSFAILSQFVFAQSTLFTYGNHAVSKDDFLKAFAKNYQGTANKNQALKDYLDLYIRFKLKVQAAYDIKLDTLLNQKSDLQSFRQQLEGPYLNDDVEMKRLIEEAFERSQKDIRISHIFIPFRGDYLANPDPQATASQGDSAKALARITEVLNKLKGGGNFEALAKEYSADPSVVSNKGDLGYITVFTLPYAMENIAYGLEQNKFSSPFMSKAGYHIFKRTGERPALGRMKASQILLANSPNASAQEKQQRRKLADSLYDVISKGGSFEEMARSYSNDKMTYVSGGQMPEFGVGQYEPAFENAAFALQKNGDLSKPFETSFGYHLLKRTEFSPITKDKAEGETRYKQLVQADARVNLAKKSFEEKVVKKVGPKKAVLNFPALWQMTDSFITKEKTISTKGITAKTTLLTFPKSKSTVSDWLYYARAMKTGESAPGVNYPTLMNEFVTYASTEYYRTHLEDYSKEFASQYNEFKEGNLLFEVMDKKVWSKAAADSVGLKKYYEQHKDKYKWGQSVDAILVNASDYTSAQKAAVQIRKDLHDWKKISNESDGRILTDSGRFEVSQLPVTDPSNVVVGLTTPLQVNPQDSSASFTFIIQLYRETSQRNFEDARGLVINDYQVELEEKWIADLKKKYPVKVNQAVFNSLLK
jgi:peptidyl-prolyl cis-trans isomerase SurA